MKLITTTILAMLLATPAMGQMLRGGVEQNENAGPVPFQTAEPSPAHMANIYLQVQPLIGGALQTNSPIGLGTEIAKMLLKHRKKKLIASTNTELYCVGLQTLNDTGRITWIDPHCAMYGILHVGDTIDSMDGERVLAYTLARHNYANASVPVKLHISYADGRQEYRLCPRVPVALVDGRGMLSPY